MQHEIYIFKPLIIQNKVLGFMASQNFLEPSTLKLVFISFLDIISLY